MGRSTGPLKEVDVEALAVVLMEGTDLAGRRRACCSGPVRCCNTLITASFSRSWECSTRILETHAEIYIDVTSDAFVTFSIQKD